MQQPQIVLLKEGTENAQGKQQVISNINACSAIVDAVRTTLGPRGMDKLIVDARGKATISNDGATIMKLLDAAGLGDPRVLQASGINDAATLLELLYEDKGEEVEVGTLEELQEYFPQEYFLQYFPHNLKEYFPQYFQEQQYLWL